MVTKLNWTEYGNTAACSINHIIAYGHAYEEYKRSLFSIASVHL